MSRPHTVHQTGLRCHHPASRRRPRTGDPSGCTVSSVDLVLRAPRDILGRTRHTLRPWHRGLLLPLHVALLGPSLGGPLQRQQMAWSEERSQALRGQDCTAEARTGAGIQAPVEWPGGESGRAMRGDTERQPVRGKTRKRRKSC